MGLVSLRNNYLFKKSKKSKKHVRLFKFVPLRWHIPKWVARSGTLGETQDATGRTHLMGGTRYPRLRTLLVVPGTAEL